MESKENYSRNEFVLEASRIVQAYGSALLHISSFENETDLIKKLGAALVVRSKAIPYYRDVTPEDVQRVTSLTPERLESVVQECDRILGI